MSSFKKWKGEVVRFFRHNMVASIITAILEMVCFVPILTVIAGHNFKNRVLQIQTKDKNTDG